MRWVVVSVLVWHSFGQAATYLPETYFSPEEAGYRLLPVESRWFLRDIDGFNPGLALLPEKTAADLDRARLGLPGGYPTYVATLRVRGGLCPYLTKEDEEDVGMIATTERRGLLRGGRRRLNEPGFATSVAILDGDLNILQRVVDESGEPWDMGREDVRLLTRREFGSKILTSSMDYPFIGNTREW